LRPSSRALEKALGALGIAFLLYAVKLLALDSENSALRKRLFTLPSREPLSG
jgi:hypothetical protein